MARGSGFNAFLRAAARASAAAQRERQRAIRAQVTAARQIERQARMARTQQAREQREAEKLAKQQYLEDRVAETEDLNAELSERLESLRGILAHTLTIDDRISFQELKLMQPFEPFRPPAHLAPGIPPREVEIPPPSGFRKLLPGSKAKHEQAVARVRIEHEERRKQFAQQESDKLAELAMLKKEYEESRTQYEAEVARKNAEVDEFEAAYRAKEPDAIVAYNEMVLSRSEYPDEGFPQKFRVAYNQDSKELVIEYDLPEASAVPTVAEYRYVKSKDTIESKPQKPAEIRQLYQDVVASIVLRTLHEVTEADQADAIAILTFTGIVDAINPADGREIRVPVVSVRTSKADFAQIRLDKVDKAVCLKNLGAQVSARPDELQAVKPIVEFDMVDKRFIGQGDALTELESRPNLLELSPSEFETLVANLFSKMGLDTKLTRASRDGGVDAVAFDTRPVLGGKVVIQAKRYRDTVGVSAVRDLYGTMMNEGANKGILVCTSGYGPDAYNFTKDKPIELIDGGGLLYLLREHANIQARIAQ
ncbi:MAG: restriction endonuclease [Betaproteobacteria bacterium HGW-Betaproteobacteria-14]|nr:MAG: restriction endonuclease [Betaproteobacteria bacterium HGW-Betaproteobacteria-14]